VGFETGPYYVDQAGLELLILLLSLLSAGIIDVHHHIHLVSLLALRSNAIALVVVALNYLTEGWSLVKMTSIYSEFCTVASENLEFRRDAYECTLYWGKCICNVLS
jgi:hypothetical protein